MSLNFSAQNSLNSKFLWNQNIFGAESFSTKKFFNQTFLGPKKFLICHYFTQIFLNPILLAKNLIRSNVLIFFSQKIFLVSHFFDPKFLWTQIFRAKHFLYQKLMSIWLNLGLQSNCLSLDWAPAQLQLVAI